MSYTSCPGVHSVLQQKKRKKKKRKSWLRGRCSYVYVFEDPVSDASQFASIIGCLNYYLTTLINTIL